MKKKIKKPRSWLGWAVVFHGKTLSYQLHDTRLPAKDRCDFFVEAGEADPPKVVRVRITEVKP